MLEVNISRSLYDFNLEVAFSTGEGILGIVGPSGSGKTMTLRCIAGLVRPDSGYIKLNDRILFDSRSGINLPGRLRKVGFVFQNYALFPHLTAAENIAFGIRDITLEKKKLIVHDLMDKMRLGGLGGRYPGQLSAGQQQRAALARALATEPDILLLDEPFSALDAPTKEQLGLQLLALRQFYKGNILLVTHDISEAYRLSSRIAVYESGKMVQCDNKEKLIQSPVNITVARLTGIKNLLAGTVAEVRDMSILVNTPEYGTFRACNPGHLKFSLGMPVTIGIRPEYIQISDKPGENTVRGIVDDIISEINACRYIFWGSDRQADGYHFEALLPSGSALMTPSSAGEVYFYIPPEKLVIISMQLDNITLK